MSKIDIEFAQSFCRKYINRAVKEHFADISSSGDSASSTSSPRLAAKRMCLHKDTDPITLTVIRLLFWWVVAKGLFDEYIYGIPSTDFDVSNTYYPQVKLHFREDKISAAANSRRPARGEVSFRWRGTDYTEVNINALAKKIRDDYAKPIFFYKRGRELWSYADKSKGYYFQMTVDSEADAKKVITQAIGIQDEGTPNWEQYLRKHEDQKNYAVAGTVKVRGEIIKKPKKRPIATVKFAYAELFIPGTVKPIILVDTTGTKANAVYYA